MQRDNAAHLPAVPANDTRDSPLNRLLRKPSPAPEAPASTLLSTQAVAPEASVSKPLVQEIVPKPLAEQVSPADLLVSKLLGRPIPGHSPAKQMSAPVSLPEDGKAIDVEYTPVEAPVAKPPSEASTTSETAARTPLPAHDTALAPSAGKSSTPHEPAPEGPVGKPQGEESAVRKPLPTLETTLKQPIAKPPLEQAPAPEAPVGTPLPAQSAARETALDQPLPAQGPLLKAPVENPPPTPRSETPVAKPSPTQSPAQETPVAKPQPTQGPAQEEPIDKPPLGPISIPDAAADKPQRTRGSALERSIGKLLPAREATEKSVSKMLALPRRTRDEREFLPAALEIVDTPPSPVGRAVGFTIILVAIIAIAWACIGQIDIVAIASGRIVPQGKTKIVQPADTGIVTAIHVADGDLVKAGDILIELNSNQVTADRDRFVRDLLQANLNLARLRGLAATLPGSAGEGRKPNLVDPPKDAKPEDLALTLAAMRAQAANENAKLADLDQQIEAKQAEAAEAAAAAQKLQASLPMVADQEKLLRTMRDQKIGSKLDWYQANQQLIEQQHEIGVLAHRKDVAAAAQRALREQRAAEAAQYQMSVLADLDKMRAQASELEAELAKSQQRTRQGVLYAPIAGTVQQLAIHTIGGVVTPAESLLAIVPAEGGLVVEAAVQNRDVGFIRAGQTVRVKVEAFNFTLYGLIEGQVIDVTRDAVSNPDNDKKNNKSGDQNSGGNVGSEENSGPVYLARIALSQDWMMTENGKVDLTPGMAVTAEIQTGQRRIISFLLSPLVRRVSESMHER
jgi:hemolysin D